MAACDNRVQSLTTFSCYAVDCSERSSTEQRLVQVTVPSLRDPSTVPTMNWQLVKIHLENRDKLGVLQLQDQYLWVQCALAQQDKTQLERLLALGFTQAAIHADLIAAIEINVCHPEVCGPNRPLLGEPGWPTRPPGGMVNFSQFSSTIQLPLSPDAEVPRKVTQLQKLLAEQQSAGASIGYLPQRLVAPSGEMQASVSGLICCKVKNLNNQKKSTIDFWVLGMGTPTPFEEAAQVGVLQSAALYRVQQKNPSEAEQLAKEFGGDIPPIYTTPLGDPSKPCNPQFIHVAGESCNYKPIQLNPIEYPLLHALYGEQRCPEGLANRTEQDAFHALLHLLILPEVAEQWSLLNRLTFKGIESWKAKTAIEQEAIGKTWLNQLCAEIRADRSQLPPFWQQLISRFNWHGHFTGHSYGGTAMSQLAAVFWRLKLLNSETQLVTFAASSPMALLADDLQQLIQQAHFISQRDPMPGANIHLTHEDLTQLLPADRVFILRANPKEPELMHPGLDHTAGMGYAPRVAAFNLAEPVKHDHLVEAVEMHYLRQPKDPVLAYMPTPDAVPGRSVIQLSYGGHYDMRKAYQYWPVETISAIGTSKL